MDKMRKDFEAWHKSNVFILTPERARFYVCDGIYCDSAIQNCWLAWKASRKAICVEIPSPELGCGNNISPTDVEIALDEVGVSYK